MTSVDEQLKLVALQRQFPRESADPPRCQFFMIECHARYAIERSTLAFRGQCEWATPVGANQIIPCSCFSSLTAATTALILRGPSLASVSPSASVVSCNHTFHMAVFHCPKRHQTNSRSLKKLSLVIKPINGFVRT